ncbi:MAG: hypothetical protein ACO3IB_03620 [Phycisphaerales bacterium]
MRYFGFTRTCSSLPRCAARALSAAALIAVAMTTTQACGQWQPSAGTSGLNMQSLLGRNGVNFAGGASGAYRSTNDAASFTASNSGNDAVGPTRGFAQDRNYVYTCTSQGVFRSADNGLTWISRSNGLSSLLTSGIMQVQSHLFVVGPVGVFRSDDQGDTWTAAGLAGIDVRCITAIGSTLFVGTSNLGIYRSTDWGASWTATSGGLSSTSFRAIEAKGTTLFAGGQIGTGVFRSTDLGASWTLLGGGLPVGSYRGFATDGRIIVAGSFTAGVFYSVDNGNRWTAINSGLTDLSIFDLEIHQGTLTAATNTQGVFRFKLLNLIDLDGDRCVGASDLTVLLGSWGPCVNCSADYDGDGVVGASDLAVLLSYWGQCG